MKRTLLLLPLFAFAGTLRAGEAHVEEIIRTVLDNVAKVKAVSPGAVPMAFWDFDGTVIDGDIAVGHKEDGREVYHGMTVEGVEAGFSSVFADKAAVDRFFASDYPEMGKTLGRWLSWPSLGQIFHGADALRLEGCLRRYAESTLKRWYFTSTLRILRALEKAGVENHIVSGSPDVFVKAAAAVAGIPRTHAVGIRLRIAGGRLTTQLEYPLSMNEGKVECVREILDACPGSVPVAAFGNSYWTDGPFMRYVATTPLPGGAKGTALMINGGTPPKGYEGLFRCVTQSESAARPGTGK